MFSGLQAAFGIFFWKSGEQRPYGIQVLPDGRLSSAAIVSLDLAVMPPRELEWRLQSRPDQFASILFRRFLEDLQSRGIRCIPRAREPAGLGVLFEAGWLPGELD
jgi:hypothetical protein